MMTGRAPASLQFGLYLAMLAFYLLTGSREEPWGDPKAAYKVWDLTTFSLKMLGRMIMGDVSWKNLSGPITIADYAGQSAQAGWINGLVQFSLRCELSGTSAPHPPFPVQHCNTFRAVERPIL